MRFRFFFWLVCSCALVGLLGGRVGAQPQPLRIGSDATYPPFESIIAGKTGTDSSDYTGFDIELGNAIGAELGRPVEWTNSAFDGIFPALLTHKFDAVMSSVTITDERKKILAFSAPYYTAGQIIAVRAYNTRIKSLGDLKGQTGIQINTTAAIVLKPYPSLPIRKYPTLDLALTDLQNGNIDSVVGDAPTVRYFLAHGFSGLKTVGTLLTKEQYGIAMRPEDKQLQSDINGALGRLKANGKYAALERKYFGASSGSAKQGEASQSAPTTAPVSDSGPSANYPVILQALARGLVLTVGLTLAAFVLGLPFGLALALGRYSGPKAVGVICTVYVELLRGTPLLVQIIFVYYALPQLIGLNLPPLLAGVLALCLNTAAYVAEIFRAGITSIERGQSEAGLSLGLSPTQTMRFVVIPQAIQRVLPPLTNEIIALLKDSSLVSVIGLAELTRSGQELASQLAAPLQVWPAVALMYLLVTFPLTRLTGYLEKRWEVHR